MTQDIIGQLFGDRGYISQELFEELYQRQLQLITRYKKNMKQKLVKLIKLTVLGSEQHMAMICASCSPSILGEFDVFFVSITQVLWFKSTTL